MSKSSRKLCLIILIVAIITSIPYLSAETSFAKAKKPSKIKNIKISATEKTAKITWSKSKSVKKYQVMVKLGKKTVKNIKTTKRSIKLKKLKKNKTYTVYIRGLNKKLKGKWKKKSFITKQKKKVEPSQPDPKEDDSNKITIGDVEDLIENGSVDAGYNDNGGVEYIYGQFTDDKVDDIDSAIDVLNKSSSLIDQSFSAEECDVYYDETTLNSTVYRFSPYYYDIPVEGSNVILEANDSGDVDGLYSTYDARIDRVDTEEDFNYWYAEYLALEHLFENNPALMEYYDIDDIDDYDLMDVVEDDIWFYADLIVYCSGTDEPPFLAYKVRLYSDSNWNDPVDSDPSIAETNINIPTYSGDENAIISDDYIPIANLDYTYYIYANGDKSEEIYLVDDGIRDVDNWKNATGYAFDEFDTLRTINVQKCNNKYRLIDTKRNLYTYKAKTSSEYEDRSLLPGDLEESVSLSTKAVSTHANMSEVYDFYKEIGRQSYDAYGGTITVSYNYTNDSKDGFENAFWSDSLEQIVFGNKGHFERALDVIGHEFTHAVIDHTACLAYSFESGALNESYADIMGQLIEGKSGNDNWLIAEDSDVTLRSMKDTDLYMQPSHYSEFVKTKKDEGGVHTNSGIFNHAAYIMMTDSRTSRINRYKWGKLFLNSLDRMSERTSFLGARYAIVSTAKKMKFSENEITAINEAFEKVGIVVPKRFRISLRWGAYPKDIDLHIVGPTTAGSDDARFHVFFEDLKYIDYQGTLAADLDHDDTDSYGPEIATIRKLNKGTYYVFVHDYTNRKSTANYTLSDSEAEVKFYLSDERLPFKTYKIPINKSGTYWNVCKITIDNDGIFNITDINTFSYQQVYN